MPIYEYKCDGCGNEFAEMVKIGETSKECPKCGNMAVKVISSVSIIFKGTGWGCKPDKK